MDDRRGREKNRVEPGVLYLVATPIGNMSDITERAVKVLSEVDLVAAEDTRNSGLLLSRLGIKKPMISYFEHNKAERGPVIVDKLRSGLSCALVTDAGTPALSDPGEDIVRLCAEAGIKTVPVPGACAAISALSVSALPSGRFVFDGFLPAASGERGVLLKEISASKLTHIIYEAPHRLKKTLDELRAACGDSRGIAVCRELTKLNEEIIRTDLAGASEIFDAREPKGEFVLVLAGAAGECPGRFADMDVRAHVGMYIAAGMTEKDAIKAAAKDRGVQKNDIYIQYKGKDHTEER